MKTKKKLLHTAVISALGLPITAQAELQIYGTAAASVESLDNGKKNTSEVSNNHSAFGIKGSVDAGDGVRGVFLYDMFVGMDDSGSGSGDTLFGGGRDGYIGLAEDDWGTVALGYHGRPWKTSTNHLDLFGSTIADYSALMGTTPGGLYFDGGIGNSIIWFAPKWGAVSMHAQYGLDEQDDGSNDMGVQVNYSTRTWYLSFSHDVDGQADPADAIRATKLAVSYTSGATTLTGMFDTISDGTSGTTNSRDAVWLGAAFKVGKKTYKLAYAVAGESDLSGGNDSATFMAVGVDHAFKNGLSVYALYSQIDNDTGGTYTYISAPHTSSNGNTAVSAGDDPSVIAIGLKYDFSYKHY